MKYSINISINTYIKDDDEIMDAADELLEIVQQGFLLEIHTYSEMSVSLDNEENSIIIFNISEIEKEDLDGAIAAAREVVAIIKEEFLINFPGSEIISVFPPIN
ncbi:hypothetical protein [uncultured Nostoc sp.]|uniref:hypothetical protein n=1 Tax=uncultured Nostoc sp. TaxID=340711 RepID=UPI0035CB08D4